MERHLSQAFLEASLPTCSNSYTYMARQAVIDWLAKQLFLPDSSLPGRERLGSGMQLSSYQYNPDLATTWPWQGELKVKLLELLIFLYIFFFLTSPSFSSDIIFSLPLPGDKGQTSVASGLNWQLAITFWD